MVIADAPDGGSGGDDSDGADEQSQSIPDDPLRGPDGDTTGPGADDGTSDGPSDGGSSGGSSGGTGGTSSPGDPLRGPDGGTTGPDPSDSPSDDGGSSPDPGSSPAPPGGETAPDDSGGSGGGTGGTTSPGDPLRGPDGGTTGPDPSSIPREAAGSTTADTGGTQDTSDPLRGPDGGTAGPDPTRTPREDQGAGGSAPTGGGAGAGTAGDAGRGYSGDPNPTGGIGPNVPARARGQAVDLRREAADQWRGAVGPEDVFVSYDEESGQLEATVTKSGVRELGARDSQYDYSDIDVAEQDGQFVPTVNEEARREQAREQLAGQIEGADAGDIGVRQTESGGYEVATVFGEEPLGTETIETDGDAPTVTDEQFSGGAVGGQTTDPTYDPSAEQPAGIGEVAVDVAQRTVEDPGGYVGGGTADFVTETQFVDVDASQRNEQVSMPGYERIRGPVQGAAQWWDENVGAATQRGAEYVTGSETVGQVYGGIARGVNPAGAVDAGLGAHEAAAYTTAGAFEGPGEAVGRAGEATERGFYVAGRGVEEAQRNPARAGGMVVGGALVGTAASAGARAGVSGARTAATRLRRSDGPDPVGGTDIRSGAPDPWEGVDPARSLREQAGPDRGRVQQLAADARQIWRSERGQAQMARGRQRQRGGEQRRGGGTTDDVRQDALTQYQDYLDDVAGRERAATRRQADPDADPVGADRPQPTYDPEAPQVPLRERPDADADAGAAGFRVRDPAAEATGLLAQAERQEVTAGDTLDAQEEALGIMEDAESGALAQETELVAESVQRGEEAMMAEVSVQGDSDGTLGSTSESLADDTAESVATDETQRTRAGQDEGTALRPGTTTDTGDPAEPGLPPITPTGVPGGPGSPPSPPPDEPPRIPRTPTPDPDLSPSGIFPALEDSASTGGVNIADGQLGPSWFAEEITYRATGEFAESPGQDTLEDYSTGIEGAGFFPTAQMLGDDETAEQIDAEWGLLDPSPGGSGVEVGLGFGDGDGSDDDSGWLEW